MTGVYRYTLKDKALPKNRNIVYCLVTEERKDVVLEIENFISTAQMLEHDRKQNSEVIT